MDSRCFSRHTMSPYGIKRDICEVGRRVYQRGYVAANDGNISARIGEDRIICTPTGVSKGYLSEEMLALCNLEGEQLSGSMKLSSEIRMHLEVYRLRPDINAVLHAHPPTATGFAVAGIELTECVLPEVVISLGGIPLAEYGTPGGRDIVEPMKPLLRDYDAILMANHGAVTLGKGVMDAHFKMETVEHFARIVLVARQLGAVQMLGADQVDDLMKLRKRFGVEGRPGCDIGDSKDESNNTADVGALVGEITREVIQRLEQTGAKA